MQNILKKYSQRRTLNSWKKGFRPKKKNHSRTHDAISFPKTTWTTIFKTALKLHWSPAIFHSGFKGFFLCASQHVDDVHDQKLHNSETVLFGAFLYLPHTPFKFCSIQTFKAFFCIMALFLLNNIFNFLFYLFYVNKLMCRLAVRVKVVGANNSGVD